MKKHILITLTLILTVFSGSHAANLIRATDLRCEYLVNPIGIDVHSPRLSWHIDVDSGIPENLIQRAYRIIVSYDYDSIVSGKGDLWDSGIVRSSEMGQILYKGKEIEPSRKCYWAVRLYDMEDASGGWSEPAYWSAAPESLDAEWIGDVHDKSLEDYLEYVSEHNQSPDFDVKRWATPPVLPSPFLRKSFIIEKGIRQAYLYATSIGCYEAWINGVKPDARLLAPEITNYDISLQYQTYDVTENLKKGKNALVFTLSDGWALGRNAGVKWLRKFPHRGFYACDRRLLAQLVIEFDDGTKTVVRSDGSWKIKTDDVPVRYADNFGGQIIDSRLYDKDLFSAEYDDSKWKNVCVDSNMKPRRLVSQSNEPIREHCVLTPKSIMRHNGRHIVDFGQNIAGHCLLRIKGRPGQAVTLRHGEWIDDDGSVYTRSLGYASATDRFILSGGDDCFEPTQTYHGFQYVEIDGIEGDLEPDMIEAHAISSDASRTGRFECSNENLNKLFENIYWTQRNNMISVLHDNPSRDERTGAAADIQIFSQTAIFNMDMAAFLSKYMDDFTHMAFNGQFFSMIPSLSREGHWNGWVGAPGWSEAGLIIPWRLYENYGDTTVIVKMYPYMKRHVDAILRENPDLIWRIRHNHNGDWLNANSISNPPDTSYSTTRGNTPDDMFATAFFAYASRMLADMAGIIGKHTDRQIYNDLWNKIRNRFIESYVKEDGYVEGNSQGAYSLALSFGLVPDSIRRKSYEKLLDCIREYDTRLSTGFITTPLMMQLLAENGDTETAYTLLESTRFPSWLYNVNNGASTVWERWDAWIPGRGFQNNAMNSFDHVAFGSVGEWMYRNILGINPDSDNPGFSQFTLRPQPGGSLSWAKGSYDSIKGTIESSWEKLQNGSIRYSFTIPANTSAKLILPAASKDISGSNVRFKDEGGGTATAMLPAGKYVFICEK